MYYTESGNIQGGRGVFHVQRQHLQRGRGLGGIFANIMRRLIPFSKTFAKGALNTGKQFIQSDEGKELINDTIASAARAAKTAIIDQNPEEAKREIKESLNRTKDKSGKVIKRIARDKLQKVLTGQGNKKALKKRKKMTSRIKKTSLLDL